MDVMQGDKPVQKYINGFSDKCIKMASSEWSLWDLVKIILLRISWSGAPESQIKYCIRRLAVNSDSFPATPAAKPAPNIIPCIALNLAGTAKRAGGGACNLGYARPPCTRPGKVTPFSPPKD